MLSRLDNSRFYRAYGVYRTSQLTQPHLASTNVFALPYNAVYHYCTWDGIGYGPLADDPIFSGITKPVYIFNIHMLNAYEGGPRRVSVNIPDMERDLRGKNRRLRTLKDIASLNNDTQTLVVYNYDFIAHCYRYTKNLYTRYSKWHNVYSEIVAQMARVADSSEHYQFLKITIPQVLPSLAQLNSAAESTPIKSGMLKVFRDEASYTLLDLWKWLSADRSTSILSTIPKDKLHLINFIVQDGSVWSVLNLGFLDSVRADDEAKGSKAEAPVPGAVQETISPVQLQKRVLVYLMQIMESRTVTANLSSKQITELETTGTIQDDDEPTPTTATIPELVDAPSVNQAPVDQRMILDDGEDDEKMLQMLEDEQINAKLDQLNSISDTEDRATVGVTVKQVLSSPALTPEQGFAQHLDHLVQTGNISAAEMNRFSKLSMRYKELPSADPKKTLDQYVNVAPEDLTVSSTQPVFADSESVLDKNMLKGSLETFDKAYRDKALKQHTVAMALGVQQAGVAVTDYTVERNESVLGRYDLHVVRLAPIQGSPSTISFRVPHLNDDGTFTANGTDYRLRKQFSDIPLRKIGPDEVALTSYYGKLFVRRGIKKAHDLTAWLHDQVMAKYYSEDKAPIVEIKTANAFSNTEKLPRLYTAAAHSFREILTDKYRLIFDRDALIKEVDGHTLAVETSHAGMTLCGLSRVSVLTMDEYGNLYSIPINNLDSEPTLIGTMLSYLGIDESNCPVEYAQLSVFGKDIPLGFVLAYYMGLSGLLDALKVDVKRVPAGTRVKIDELTEYAIAFSDETLVLPKDNTLASMVLAGLVLYAKVLKLYSVYSFDQKAVYLNILEANSMSVRYVREMDLIDQMFVDPITLMRLKTLKLPQTLRGLLFESARLLQTDQHPDEMDLNYMNIKGSELIAGAVYAELVQSLRAHNAQHGKSNRKIEMNPHAVWIRIVDDPVKMQESQINPLMELKSIEAVTFSGTGGRNRRSMTKDTRIMHPSHQGVISEATVDSSDTGINVFLSPNAKFKNALGMIDKYDYNKDGMPSTLSSSALVCPASTNDDMRRVAFISIQQAHSVACQGYHQSTVRTGYEEIVPQRTGSMYAITAKQPGKVTDVNEHGVIIEYEDGQVQGYETGIRCGKAAGLVIPHNIVTPLKKGEKVQVGYPIIYNSGFFEPDFFDPKKIVWKNSMDATTVLWESVDTHDDASSISVEFSQRMKTTIAKVKTVVVAFDTVVSRLIPIGKEVEFSTSVCVLQDSVSAASGAFDETTLDSLSELSTQSPKAGVKGKVSNVEIYYHGDLEDMGDSLRSLARISDKRMADKAKALGKTAYTGQVDSGFRIDGDALPLDHVAIQVTILQDVSMGVGDKGVFGAQLKSVISATMTSPMTTKSGRKIDAIFGYKSIDDRIVFSPYILGSTSMVLEALADKMVSEYYS